MADQRVKRGAVNSQLLEWDSSDHPTTHTTPSPNPTSQTARTGWTSTQEHDQPCRKSPRDPAHKRATDDHRTAIVNKLVPAVARGQLTPRGARGPFRPGLVRPWGRMICDGTGILGDFSSGIHGSVTIRPSDPLGDAPAVRARGLAVMGGVSVATRARG